MTRAVFYNPFYRKFYREQLPRAASYNHFYRKQLPRAVIVIKFYLVLVLSLRRLIDNFFYFPIFFAFFSAAMENQARDAKEIMANGYEAVDIQPFDLFPQTRHIENIITFQDTRKP